MIKKRKLKKIKNLCKKNGILIIKFQKKIKKKRKIMKKKCKSKKFIHKK